MIDLHSHILPGLDDGAQTLDESLAMARAAVAAGVTAVAGTPHVRADYPTSPEEMEEALGGLRAALVELEIPIDVHGGGELDIDVLASTPLERLRRFGLAGNPEYLLVESPYSGWPLQIGELFFELRLRGVTPVLAHPERNPEVQARPGLLRSLVDAGALVQVTAASLDGRLGSRPRRTAAALLRAELVHLVASDAHSTRMRGFEHLAAVAAIGDEALARWLLDDVAEAIVTGAPLGARPTVAPRQRPRILRRRA